MAYCDRSGFYGDILDVNPVQNGDNCEIDRNAQSDFYKRLWQSSTPPGFIFHRFCFDPFPTTVSYNDWRNVRY